MTMGVEEVEFLEGMWAMTDDWDQVWGKGLTVMDGLNLAYCKASRRRTLARYSARKTSFHRDTLFLSDELYTSLATHLGHFLLQPLSTLLTRRTLVIPSPEPTKLFQIGLHRASGDVGVKRVDEFGGGRGVG